MRKLAFLAAALLPVAAVVAVLLRGGPGSPERAPAPAVAQAAGPDLAGRRGALVDEIVFTQESDVGKIAALIEGGSHHVFAQGITSPMVFHRLRDSERAAYELSYGTSLELTLNPAGPELANGELNPFAVPEIREALNRLVNRRYIAEEIYGGLAAPRVLPLNTVFPDYARLADVARALELRYQYAPEVATHVIHEQMEALGARLEDGIWTYDSRPVRISVLIRTEDERKRVGDYVANLLEDIGFRVERLYRTAEEASRIWIAGDPHAGRWHVYTGSWISTLINRDLSDNFSYYYTPRGRPEPLWQAYRPAPELDEIADRLQRRDYASWDERQELMARALELAMKDSARIWLVDQINLTPRAQNVELAADLAGGVSGSWLWANTLRFDDRIGGRAVIAAPSLLTEPWNLVAGSNWAYDMMIVRALLDTELLPDPFTGLYWPQRIARAEVTVQEKVPVGRSHDWLTLETLPEIRVPEDAWIDWDAAAGRFLTVDEKFPDGLTVRTRVLVDYEDGYLERRWHDGSQVSLADVVLPWILTFARADENSPLFDRSHLPSFELFQRHFRGWRIVSHEPLVIEIYSDQIYPDAETIVAVRTPSAQPWHVLALGILAERGGDLAFSSNKADREEVNWMSLVAGPSLPVLARHLAAAQRQGFVPFPEVLGDLLRDGEVADRYRALDDWYQSRGHFWVGDGPFYLHSVHPVERNVVLRRYEDFPDPADKWLRFTRPEIPELELGGPMMVEAGDAVDFELRITLAGEPYPSEDIESVQFLLFDGSGELALKGDVEAEAEGLWMVRLTPEQLAPLGTGANSVEVAVTSRRVALPAFASHAFATVPPGTPVLAGAS
jgi:peptide/nickel transport system substrate-binding protein